MTDVPAAPAKPPSHDANGRLLPGNKLSPGRPKGTPNKRTTQAARLAEDMGIDPLAVLLMIAGNKFSDLNPEYLPHQLKNKEGVPKSVPLEIRRAAAADAAKFIYPTRKAIEVTGEDGGPVEAFLALGEEGLAKRRAELAMALDEDV